MNLIPFAFKHMKKLRNHFGHPRGSHLVDPATGWIQEIQATSKETSKKCRIQSNCNICDNELDSIWI